MLDFTQYRIDSQQTFTINDFLSHQNGGMTQKQLKQKHKEYIKKIAELQQILYAQSKRSLLVVFQAMDAAGKDSSIKKLTKGLNAQGCHVHSFKTPTKKEKTHDFLWRVHACVPGAGEIGIFNRSHYEDVLISRVHGWVDEQTIVERYQQINDFERLLSARGTQIIKFMLNISPEFQLQRFRSRLENPDKLWKFNPGDLDERARWNDYMQAFENAIAHCASKGAPWYIVPAENRAYRDCVIASVIVNVLQNMQLQYPNAEFDLQQYPPNSLK